jgi:uncharacterized membrane protein YhaH (DUF805 family)
VSRLFRFWWTFDDPVDAAAYRAHGLALVIVKYAGDAALVGLATGRLWSPLDYVSSIPHVLATLRDAPSWLFPALAIWTLPFFWAGITLTVRRAIDAGRSPWWTMLFFVPLLNYGLMLVLAVLPSAPRRERPAPAERPERRSAWTTTVSVVPAVAVGVGMMVITVRVFREYSLALFFGTPFAMGAIAGFLFNRRYSGEYLETAKATSIAFLLAAGVTFVFAAEGVICLLMAMPLVLPVGLLGAYMGRAIALRGQHSMPPALFALLALPVASALEPSHATGRVLHEVVTLVEIQAAPERVWPHIVAFRPITEPEDLIFRLGIAAPQSARLDGQGVGAMRYCEFSTGAFVEPITAWEPARRLAFDVVRSPSPLRELSPYSNVSPPHLDGYLRSRRGEFRLVPLPDGRTRLEGRTWYELEMAPEGYWQLVADSLIHRIHDRVLNHIKREVDRSKQSDVHGLWRVGGLLDRQPHAAHGNPVESIELAESDRRAVNERPPLTAVRRLEAIARHRLPARDVLPKIDDPHCDRSPEIDLRHRGSFARPVPPNAPASGPVVGEQRGQARAHPREPSHIGVVQEAVAHGRHVEQQLRVPADRREVQLHERIDRLHACVLGWMMEPSRPDRDVGFAGPPRGSRGVAVLQHAHDGVAAGARKRHNSRIDGGPVRLGGHATLVADPADVGPRV